MVGNSPLSLLNIPLLFIGLFTSHTVNVDSNQSVCMCVCFLSMIKLVLVLRVPNVQGTRYVPLTCGEAYQNQPVVWKKNGNTTVTIATDTTSTTTCTSNSTCANMLDKI